MFVEDLCLTLFIGALKLSMAFDEVISYIVSETITADHVKTFVEISKLLNLTHFDRSCTIRICALYGLVAIMIIIKRIVKFVYILQ